jgi:hypothetical protein
MLDERHAYLFDIVGLRVGLEKYEVEEACLDGNQV